MRAQVSGAQRRAVTRPLRRGRRGEGGLTLIEMLVALSVISIAVVGIAYGFSAVVRSSGNAQTQATLDVAARDAADYVQSSLQYNPCDSPAYSLSRLSTPPGVSWAITSVSESSAASLAGFTTPQPCTTGYDYGVQEITITVTKGSSSLTQVVWKAAAS